jgi:hypothetical protein
MPTKMYERRPHPATRFLERHLRTELLHLLGPESRRDQRCPHRAGRHAVNADSSLSPRLCHHRLHDRGMHAQQPTPYLAEDTSFSVCWPRQLRKLDPATRWPSARSYGNHTSLPRARKWGEAPTRQRMHPRSGILTRVPDAEGRHAPARHRDLAAKSRSDVCHLLASA